MMLRTCAALAAFIVVSGVSAQAGYDSFYDMCYDVSLNDGLPDDAAASFCECLTAEADADSALYDELYEAGTSEPDLDTRLGLLSEGARSAAESCQG